MSYKHFAEYELQVAGADAVTKKIVLTLIELSEANEHSGASISVYHDYVRRILVAGAADHLPDELKPAFKGIDLASNEGRELVANAMFVFNAIINFEPLTPLTGEDDEWHDVGYNERRTVYQNRRLSTVFKEDGKAYRIGHTLFARPTADYHGWHQVDRGRDLSSQSVVFPYDASAPENKIQMRYFADESWAHELPPGVEPQAWLEWLRKRYVIGIDPTTNKVRQDVMFVDYDNVLRLATMLRNLLCYVKYTEGQPLFEVKQKLSDLHRYHAHFALEWTEPESEGDGRTSYKAVFTNPTQAARLLRLLELIPDNIDYMVGSEDDEDAPFFIDRDHNEYHLCFTNMVTPLGRYQGWEHGGQYVLVFVKRDEQFEPFYFDDGYQVLGDVDDYLYQKRRDYNYAHPRGRGTTHYKVVDQLPHIDPQEGEQIDNVVSKHVGQVFGTKKKD